MLRTLVTVVAVIDYSTPGPLTSLEGISPEALAAVGHDPVEICAPVHALVIQPSGAETLGLAPERFVTNQIRPAAKLIEALLSPRPGPAQHATPA